jgi:hypothetical protein
MTLPPHERQLVHRETAAEPEDGYDDGEADGDLGRRHTQDEEDEGLAVDGAVALAERHEARLAALSMISMDMKMTSGLRRTSTPRRPITKSTADTPT